MVQVGWASEDKGLIIPSPLLSPGICCQSWIRSSHPLLPTQGAPGRLQFINAEKTPLPLPRLGDAGVPAGTQLQAWPLRAPWASGRVWGELCGGSVGPEGGIGLGERRVSEEHFKKMTRGAPGRRGCSSSLGCVCVCVCGESGLQMPARYFPWGNGEP